jgi:hypothetical protein
MGTAPLKNGTYSGSAFLLAVAAALQSGGFAVTIRPYLWAVAAAALFYDFLTSNGFLRQHLPGVSKPLTALAISALALAIIVAANYSTPTVFLQIANREPYVIQAQSDGSKWVKIAATRLSSGEGICRAYIDGLWQGTAPIMQDEHRLLHADDSGDPGLAEGFHMGGGMERFFNIAFIRLGENAMHIGSKAFNDLITKPLGPGNYHAKIEVSGTDCGPAYADVWIQYRGGQDVSVKPIRSFWSFL